MKELQIELIAVGDEILIGHTLDTNSHWIANLLSEAGLRIRWMSAVGDDANDMRHLLRHAWNRADVVLITGGLGPTPDDITRPTLARFFDDELIERLDLRALIHDRFEARGLPLPYGCEIMAQFPSRAQPILNREGSAPGIHYSEEGRELFSMPGVPSEMREMMTEYVLPRLRQRAQGVYCFHLLKTIGIWESQLYQIIGETEALAPVQLAYLPSIDHGVTLRLSLAGTDEAAVKDELNRKVNLLRHKIAPHVFCEDTRSIDEVLLQMLRERGERLAAAESCTGGLLCHRLVSIPGSSDVLDRGFVTYSNQSKIDLLGVRAETLARWGAVSEETAAEMAEGARRAAGVEHALSVTGIAGPSGGTAEKPVGLVYVGYSGPGGAVVESRRFSGSRDANRRRSAAAALTLLWRQIKDLSA